MRWGQGLVALGFFLMGCRREIPLPSYKAGQALFPLYTGLVRVYQVRETTYTTTGAEGKVYFVRMRIDTPTTDAYGRRAFYVLWDTASVQDSGAWGFWRAGLAYRDSVQAELWEDNRRYLLLRFPLAPHVRWNRNEYTDLPPEICRYGAIDTLFPTPTRTLPHSAWIVRRVDTLGLLLKAYFYDVFSRDVGLSYRYERQDVFDLNANGSLVRNTDSYFREWVLVAP